MGLLTPAQYYKAQRVYRSMGSADGKLAGFIQKYERGEIDVDAMYKERLAGEAPPDELDAAVQQAEAALVEGMRSRELEKLISREYRLPVLIALKTRYAALQLYSDSVESSAVPAGIWDQDRLDEVKRDLEWCLAKDPAYWLAHKWLAVALSRIGELQRKGVYRPRRPIAFAEEESVFAALRALILRPDVVQLWDLVGRICDKVGDVPEAVRAWKMGCKLRNLECAVGYGQCALRHKSKVLAAASFSLAREIDPDWGNRNIELLAQVGLDHVGGDESDGDAPDTTSVMQECLPAELATLPLEWGLDVCWV